MLILQCKIQYFHRCAVFRHLRCTVIFESKTYAKLTKFSQESTSKTYQQKASKHHPKIHENLTKIKQKCEPESVQKGFEKSSACASDFGSNICCQNWVFGSFRGPRGSLFRAFCVKLRKKISQNWAIVLFGVPREAFGSPQDLQVPQDSSRGAWRLPKASQMRPKSGPRGSKTLPRGSN